MYYYCYISEAKVNQLLEGVVGAIQEASESSRNAKGGLSAAILKMFGANVEYGRSKTLRVWMERRMTLASRLKEALSVLDKRIGLPPLLTQCLRVGKPPTPGLYRYHGPLTVAKYDENYVYMTAQLKRGWQLSLTGSLRYFSDMTDHEGNYMPHSGNAAFFTGEVTPEFEAMVFVIQVRDKSVIGTPLFLGLPLDSGLTL